MNYKKKRWLDKRERILRRDKYLCCECRRYKAVPKPASVVHHCWPADEYPEYRYADWNLISLCAKHHDAMHDRLSGKLTTHGEWWKRRRSPPPSDSSRCPSGTEGAGVFPIERTGTGRGDRRRTNKPQACAGTLKAASENQRQKLGKSVQIGHGKETKMSKKSCEEIRSLMRIAKTYSPAFEPIIELLDRTRSELRKAEKAWRDGGGEFTSTYTNKAGAENVVKNPDFAIVEDLRQDVLAISSQLGLTPQGQRRVIGSGKLPSRTDSDKLTEALKNAAKAAGKC